MLIRELQINDIFDIFVWRNDIKTVFYSKKNKKIKFFEHLGWYIRFLINLNIRIYIGLKKKNQKLLKIGIVRFDIKKKIATVSINLNPEFRSKKYSSHLLKLSIKKFLKFKKINLNAIIKNDNLSSIKCFKNNRFILSNSRSKFSIYKKFLN